jgi:signal transduction histidine kinase
MKKAPEKSSRTQLSYEELNDLCRALQDRVTQGIGIQQELISIRDELDQELDRYRLIQEFSKLSLSQDQLSTFSEIAVEYFVKGFEQPRCFFAYFDHEQKHFIPLSQFGFSQQSLPPSFTVSAQLENLGGGDFLNTYKEVRDQLSFLLLEDALIAPLIGPDQKINGIIVCGQQQKDQRFYPPITKKELPAFMVMADKTAYLLHHFKATEQLKQEIKERKKVEKMLEAKAADLLRSNAELDQYASVVSHDLKAPLQNVKGYAQLLDQKYQEVLSTEGQQYLEVILKEMTRFETIINALLKYARLSTPAHEQRTAVDFQQLIVKIEAQLYLLLQEKQVTITYGELPVITANKYQMEQLLLNLITNAIKFTPKDKSPKIRIDTHLDKKYAHFCISDNGIGLSPDHRKSIFRLFKRLHADHEYEGSGIGLSICQKIITQHKGQIWAESEGLGKGTSFHFTLPI